MQQHDIPCFSQSIQMRFPHRPTACICPLCPSLKEYDLENKLKKHGSKAEREREREGWNKERNGVKMSPSQIWIVMSHDKRQCRVLLHYNAHDALSPPGTTEPLQPHNAPCFQPRDAPFRIASVRGYTSADDPMHPLHRDPCVMSVCGVSRCLSWNTR